MLVQRKGHCISRYIFYVLRPRRILDCSDAFKVYFCRRCAKMMTTANKEKNLFKCTRCRNSVNVSEVRIPYAAKLLLQEIEAMAISTRLITA